jgi:Skp family chaperone for outer membrane proteins
LPTSASPPPVRTRSRPPRRRSKRRTRRQIDQQQSRGQTLQAEVNVLIAKYNEEIKKTPRNETAVAAAGKAVQDKQRAAQTELGQIGAPVDLAIAYVEDQISLRMNEAIKAAMTAKKVDLLVNPEAVLARENNVDITDAVVAELNRSCRTCRPRFQPAISPASWSSSVTSS